MGSDMFLDPPAPPTPPKEPKTLSRTDARHLLRLLMRSLREPELVITDKEWKRVEGYAKKLDMELE